MRRIYFFIPDIATTKLIVDDLLMAKIEDRHIHVIAKRGTPLEKLLRPICYKKVTLFQRYSRDWHLEEQQVCWQD